MYIITKTICPGWEMGKEVSSQMLRERFAEDARIGFAPYVIEILIGAEYIQPIIR